MKAKLLLNLFMFMFIPIVAAAQGKPEVPEYKEEEITVKNGEITLSGTLTLPLSPVPAPAVILITGSGQQNRDEEIFGFKIFGIMADWLTKKGFAVLRLDDRGNGGSTGNYAASTDKDFQSDINRALDFLKTRKEINSTQIGLMGHSEGGLVAQMTAAERNDVAFIILMSAPGVKGDTLIISQMMWMLKQTGVREEEIGKKIALQKRIYTAVRTGKGWESIISELRPLFEEPYNKLSETMKSKLPPKEEYLGKLIDQQIASARTDWFKSFIDTDPAVYLSKINIPVLILFGGKDIQVQTELNKTAMISALEKAGNKNYTIKEFPGANHLYQNAQTGSPQEYTLLKKEFVPGFLDTITDWLIEFYPNLSRMHDHGKGSIILRK